MSDCPKRRMNILDVATATPKQGVFPNISREEYHSTPGLNPSTIVYRRKSALAAKYAYEEQWKDTDAKLFGRCCHSLLFEGNRFEQDWMVWPEGKRRHGKEWDAFEADAKDAGKEIIKDGDQLYGFRLALESVTTALKKPEIRRLVAEGQSEVAVFSMEHDLQCRGRLDWIDTAGGHIVDAKFTNDIDPKVFGRSAGGFAYHVKMACYRRWFQRESGKAINGVKLLTIEVQPPFDCAVVTITEDQLEDGWAQAEELIGQLAQNIRSNTWPGVDEGNPEIPLDLPYWALMQDHLNLNVETEDNVEI